MANELRHADVGTALSKAEWEAVGSHILNSQAAGDIIYASSTSQLSRLGIGSAKQMLAVNSGGTAPEWVSSPPVVTALVPDAADGATIGTASLEFSDIYLADSAVVYFGNDQDVTLTHVADAGLLLNAGMYLTFRDAALKIYSSTDGQLDIDADTEVEITATTVDLNGNLDVSGTYTGGGLMTTGGNIVIPNAGNIGSASDTDAIAISSGGVVTMNQIPVFSAGINVSGGSIAGTLSTAAQGNVTSLGTLTALTVDNIAINGTTIGHTSDTDLLTLTSGNLTIAGTTTLGGHVLTGGDRSIYGSSATSAGGGARLRMLPNSSSTPFIFYTQDNDDDADVIRLKLPGGAATTGTVAWENINVMTIDQAATIQTTTGALTIDGDDGIVLNTGGSGNVIVSEAMSVGATTAPDGTLHVHAGSAGSVTASSLADDLVVENSATGGISILVPDDANAMLNFGSASDNYGAQIYWDYDGNKLVVGTANAGDKIIFQTADGTESAHLSGGATPTFQFQGATTLSTSTGALTIDGDDGIVLQTTGSGGVQVNEELTVGVDDTGYDVKFFGATAGSYMLWDESSNLLQVVNGVLEVETSGADSNAYMLFDNDARLFYVGLFGDDSDTFKIRDSAGGGTDLFKITAGGDASIVGATPSLTIGDGGAEDTMLRFDGNEGDWYVALDDSNNSFMIGEGSTVGSDYRYRISDSGDYNYAHYMYHSFTSNGGGTTAVGLAVGVTLTGHADDSAFLAHMAVGEDIGGANITVNGNVTNVTTLHLSEPEINVSSGTVTNASTLYIANGPSEGTNDYAIFVDSANLNRFDGSMQIGGDITMDSNGGWVYMKGGASSTNATGIAWTFNSADTRYSEIQMDYDTRASVGFLIHSGYPITIDATTQINFDLAGATHMRVSGANPVVTIGDGGAEDTVLLFDGNAINFHAALDDSADAFVIGEGDTAGTTKRFTINATGKHYWGMSTYGAYTSSGSSSVAVGFAFETAVTAVEGDNSYQAHVIAGSNTSGSITTQNQSETIAVVSTFYINEPDITKGNDTITNAATVYIAGDPTEGEDNYALYVSSGTTYFGGRTEIPSAGLWLSTATSTNYKISGTSVGSGTSNVYIGNQQVTTSSDMRLKTDIAPTSVNALELVDKFNVVDFGWNDPSESEAIHGKNYRGKYMGMLAQDTVKVAPWVINDQGGGRDCTECMAGLECDSHGMFMVEYQHLVPTLIKAVQELRQELQEVRNGNG